MLYHVLGNKEDISPNYSLRPQKQKLWMKTPSKMGLNIIGFCLAKELVQAIQAERKVCYKLEENRSKLRPLERRYINIHMY